MIPAASADERILLIRRQRVMLDVDLAVLYGVPTRVLNQAVKRNLKRFPEDFMFQITQNEKHELITICDRFKNLKHSIALPYAFTEHGAIMAATVLNSARAIEMSVNVVRAFIKLREMLLQHKDLSHKLADLEARIGTHDKAIRSLFDAIRQLMTPPKKEKRRVGFVTEK